MKVLRRDHRSGFTIVEVVLAMGILLVGAAAILSMLTFGASLTRAAQLRSAAAVAVAPSETISDTHVKFLQDREIGRFLDSLSRLMADRPISIITTFPTSL